MRKFNLSDSINRCISTPSFFYQNGIQSTFNKIVTETYWKD